ncbi:carboxymethylenebutenolidase like protein [Heterostelium album PN500]|uniref:Carboxymethylenebutenolidase like protein n=1 Tax=Heterostelium pallidum (strain ATCC 26659 / Pp 5 / PN500) TaxID=670386 RepID=D3BDY9_HETP5|nr:carboxymethylenebutenolidase like protein [Heterostelium album PN500]EFA80120.1 carboxymethylenebutenolidase like protein [Heterostelium album PN500]|eukprot:XP_020432240.1 carboxymethylenebutenolidase like protein [Heterostelium album PN500]
MPYIDLEMDDGLVCDAYYALPEGDLGGKKAPAVLFFMDAIGLRPYLEEMANRIAKQGYFVLQPNLYYRSGRAPLIPNLSDFLSAPEKRPLLFQQLQPIMSAFTPAAIHADTPKYLKFIDSQECVESGSAVGITGYCMGGTNATRIASSFPERFAALGSWHAGRLVTDAENSVHLGLGSLKAECYFGHADNDANMTPEQIKTLEQTLDAHHIKYTSIKYENAPHGYTMKDTPMYQEAATEAHWSALLSLFNRTLKK